MLGAFHSIVLNPLQTSVALMISENSFICCSFDLYNLIGLVYFLSFIIVNIDLKMIPNVEYHDLYYN
jgi:hypothetical protein